MEIKVFDEKDFPAYLPKLNQLYDDLFQGGKGFRAKMIQMLAAELALPSKTEVLLAQTIEFIHNASLLHDDLVDRSHLRRGKTAAWLRFTPEYAVLAGDYLLARVMVNLSQFGNIQLVQLTAQTISDLLEGEWLQDSLVGDADVELSQLDRVHNLKTASLFKWCLRAPFVALNKNEAPLHTTLEELGTILGQLFQRSDDLLDFDIRNYEGKAILGDLKSGYFNSFTAYSCKALSSEQRQALKKISHLEDFYSAIGGESKFKVAVEKFDEQNQFLIQLYHHHLRTLRGFLTEDQQPLIEKLERLPDVLYWRRV